MTSTAEVLEGELVPYQPPSQPPTTLFRTDDPVELIARATAIANPLADLVRKQKLTVKIGQGEHVLVDAWTLLGNMLGVFAVLDGDPEQVEVVGSNGQTIQGWKARVSAVTRDGSVVGRAVGLCLRSEPSWRSRDDYALASMAQTRATSKALRQPLGFVMSLAGFSATPAEEMPAEEPSRPAAESQFKMPDAPAAGKASSAQRKKITGLVEQMEAKVPTIGVAGQQQWAEWAIEQMAERYGVRATGELTGVQADEFAAFLKYELDGLSVPFS